MNGMRPIHPGEILREEFMEPHGLSANALAYNDWQHGCKGVESC